MITTDWSTTYDDLICKAITVGKVSGELNGVPTKVVESGLAHVFFYGDTVYKMYKTHDDKDHFIKGILAPTQNRTKFIEHDFKLNQHFSQSIYRKLHSLYYVDGVVQVVPLDDNSIYFLVEMERLDFDTNLHEKLLAGEVDRESFYTLGFETAKAIDTCPIKAPAEADWYSLASDRVAMLRQFIDWLPEEFGLILKEADIISHLETHLDKNQHEYRLIKGDLLSVNVDNHDENVFLINGKPQFIDLLPPMQAWWYGVHYSNISNLVANIEVLHSRTAADDVLSGYLDYYQIESLPEHIFGFTQAFAYLISIAHFGSIPEKREVALKYLARLPDIVSWL